MAGGTFFPFVECLPVGSTVAAADLAAPFFCFDSRCRCDFLPPTNSSCICVCVCVCVCV